MGHEGDSISFLPILLVISLAFFVPWLLAKFRAIPVVVGEILAGILIGKSGLNLVQGEFTLEFVAEIGFAFLMFLSGLEIDFSILFDRDKNAEDQFNPLPLAIINFALALVFAIGAGWLLHSIGLVSDPWIMALILSTTSLGIVVPVLKERGISFQKYGQTLIISALMADFITMLLITVYAALYSKGITPEILLVLVLFLAFLVAYRAGNRWLNNSTIRTLLNQISGTTSQVKVRGAITLMMGFVVLAETLNMELILGAFLAGALIAMIKPKEDDSLTDKLEALGYGFFIPVFFIMVGVSFNLPALLGDTKAMLLAPLLLAIAFGVKVFSAIIFKNNFSWKEALAGGTLLSSRLSLIIAASAIGLGMGIITPEVNSAIILVAILTAILSPLLFNMIIPPSETDVVRRFMIFGGANLGVQVGLELRSHEEMVCFLESDPEIAKNIRKEGFNVLEGEGTRECLEKANAAELEALLVLSDDDKENYEVSLIARTMGVERVIAMVNDPIQANKYKKIGVNIIGDRIYRPMMVASIARIPNFFDLLIGNQAEREIRRIQIHNSSFHGKTISKLVLPGDTLILSVLRDGDTIIPQGNTHLEVGDRITVIGDRDSLIGLRNLMGRRSG